MEIDNRFLPARIAAGDKAVANANSIQDILDSPETLALMQQLLGPFVAQYSHSALIGSLSGFAVWAAAHYGLSLPPAVAELLCVGAMVVASYAYQMYSMWAAKQKAPIKPTELNI